MEIAVVIIIVVIAVGAVVLPLLRRDRSTPDVAVADAEVLDDAALEAEIDRYRAAVRAGTVCRRCGQANPAGSVYCYECGQALAARGTRKQRRRGVGGRA